MLVLCKCKPHLLNLVQVTGSMDDSNQCGLWDDLVTYYGVALFFVAVTIVSAFSLIQRRRKLKRECCCGVPGLFPPLDFLSGQPSRLILILSLTALSGHVTLNIIIAPVVFNFNQIAVHILTVFVRLFWILYISVLYIPLVTCSGTPIPIIGYLTGGIYTILLMTHFVFWGYSFQRDCLYLNSVSDISSPELATTFVGITPIYLCLLGIMLWYVVQVIKEIVLNLKHKERGWVRSYSILHVNSYKFVKDLIQYRHSTMEHVEIKSNPNMLSRILNKVYTNCPGFRFPIRVSIALTGSLAVLYELTFLIIPHFLEFGNNLQTQLGNISNTLNISCDNVTSQAEQTVCNLLDRREMIVTGMTACLIIGPVVAFPLALLHFIPIMKSVRSHLLKAYKGDMSFIPQGVSLSPTFVIASAMKYPGYQIGHLVWSWCLYLLVVWLLEVILLLILLAFVFAFNTFILLITSLVLTITVNIIVLVFQMVTSKFWFLEKEASAQEDIVITNRRLYLIINYLIYCYNGFLGFGASLIRTIVSMVMGLVYMPRMDTQALRSAKLDKGHLIYLGFIKLEAIQNNPIVHVFLDLVSQSVQDRQREKSLTVENNSNEQSRQDTNVTEQNGVEEIEETLTLEDQDSLRHGGTQVTINSMALYDLLGSKWPRVSQKAYNRWHVAYFLVRNPSLVIYRCHNLTTISDSSML